MNMTSLILDIIVLMIIGFSILISVKKGFLKTVIDTFSFLLAIIIALALLSPAKELIRKTSIDEKLYDSTSEEIDSAVGNKDLGELIENIGHKDETPAENGEEQTNEDQKLNGLTNKFVSLLERFGIKTNDIKTKYQSLLKEKSRDLRSDIITYIAKPVTNAIVTVIAFILLFILALIVLKIISHILDFATKLPIINGINKFLGIPLGAFLALFRCYCFSAVVAFFLPYATAFNVGSLDQAAIDQSTIFRFFFENNILFSLLS